MKLRTFRVSKQEGSILGYYIIVLIVLGAIASVAAYVVQHVQLGKRRSDRKNALEYTEGAAHIACQELNKAYTNSGSFYSNLVTAGYSMNQALSSGSQLVYERPVAAPFSNQTAQVQIWTTNTSSPTKARVVSYANVGSITRTSTVYLAMQSGSAYGGLGAAIISDAAGSTSTNVNKSTAQDGNVIVDGAAMSSTKVHGGILANGSIGLNVGTNSVAAGTLSPSLYGSDNEIPDYTDDGSTNQLFDFNRFIAAAQLSGNYYSNLSTFITAANSSTLEGVVVVNIVKGAKGQPTSLDPKALPNGINIKGTLVFNFSGYASDDKLVNTAAININPADLSGLDVSNPDTFTSGYPPTYANASKNPTNINMAIRNYENFLPDDDLPALMYNIGILDIHGPANICGVVYSPSFMEIENKGKGATQYFNGTLIGGGGVYVENGNNGSKSVVAYDSRTIDRLVTSGTKGKNVQVYYRK